MPSDFDNILDECISRITLRGESVEECLASYPDYAVELEPYLRTAAQMGTTLSFTPAADAKERGRELLRGEMRRLRERGAGRHWPWLPRPRFTVPAYRHLAVAMTSMSLALLVGVGTVAASGNALPGDLLYPVKEKREEVQLALTFSKKDKALTQLALSERRTEEISKLVQEGKGQHVDIAVQRLDQHLKSVAALTSRIQDPESVTQIRAKLEASSSRSLKNLQQAWQQSPESQRDIAEETFVAAGQS